jgi:hypothetical protein
MLPRAKLIIWLFALLILICGISFSGDAFAADKENCLMCHKYSGLGRFDESGHRRIFFINEETYRSTVHGFLRCRQCHQDLKEIPHTGTKGVSCMVDCHLIEPSTREWGDKKKNFSHQRVADIYDSSVHNLKTRRDGKERANVTDVPDCKYCHTNPLYLAEATSEEAKKKEKAIVYDVCGQCHENIDWAKRFYGHFTRRMDKRRGAAEMVELCLSCHSDVTMMNRNALPPINAFEDSFHFKAIKFGNERVPDCLGCHAPVGFPAHQIKSINDPESAVYAENRLKNTCGLADCHGLETTEEFASGVVHNIDVDIEVGEDITRDIALGYIKDTIETGKKFDDIMVMGETEGEETGMEDFILKTVRFIYMYLIIAPTLGGMLLHQFLDFYSTLRERRKKKGGSH